MRAPGDLAAQRVRLIVSQPHAWQVVGGQQLGEHRGVDLVVLTLASAIARVFWGLEITTLAALPSSSLAIACVLHVASSATSSLGAKLSAKRRNPSGVAGT